MSGTGQWADLKVRIASAVVMLAILFAALWIGNPIWALLVTAILCGMLWELARLCDVQLPSLHRILLALTPFAALIIMAVFDLMNAVDPSRISQFVVGSGLSPALILIITVATAGLILLRDGRLIWVSYGAMLCVASLVFLNVFGIYGPGGILFLVAIAVISDVLGYFAGRMLGGPKFWPAISPKKTWSGTLAGWIGAGLFGALFLSQVDAISAMGGALSCILLAFAGQMGDIAASAMKRRVGVKDASNLIPGHGGLLDRLDAVVAIAFTAGLLGLFLG